MAQSKLYSDKFLRHILATNQKIASIGVSLNPIRPSYYVVRYLILQGFTIFPVNPLYAGKFLFGRKVYANLLEIEEPVDMVQIFRKSEVVPEILESAIQNLHDLKTIWMQIGVMHEEAAAKARKHGLNVVQNLCPKMEYQRFTGELGKYGVNTGFISSRLQILQ